MMMALADKNTSPRPGTQGTAPAWPGVERTCILRLIGANTNVKMKFKRLARANAASSGPMMETTLLPGFRMPRDFSIESPRTVPRTAS